MSDLLKMMKGLYLLAKNGDFEWREYHPNHIKSNSVDGIYTEFCLKNGATYTYYKYTIGYKYRVDEDMCSHPEEGIRYFCLYSFRLSGLPDEYETPDFDCVEPDFRVSVNDFGYFCAIFDDEQTAKKAMKNHILFGLYPYAYILEDEELKELAAFLEENGEDVNV